MKVIIRWIVTAVAVAAAVWLVPGIHIVGGQTAALAIAVASLVLALINMFIKPIVQVLSCPLVILTLGLFYLVITHSRPGICRSIVLAKNARHARPLLSIQIVQQPQTKL